MQTQERIVKLFGADGFKTWGYKPPNVAVGWRAGPHREPALSICINPKLMQKLGWLSKDRISYRLDYAANHIVVMRNRLGSNQVSWHAGRGVIEINVPEIDRTAKTIAKPAGYQIKDGQVLIVEMPHWMVQKSASPAAARTQPKAPTPKPKPKPAPKPYVGIMSRTVDPAAVARGKR